VVGDESNPMMGRAVALVELVDYQEGSVVSRTLMQHDVGTVTLFAFASGEGLSEHTAPYDAMVQVIEGRAHIRIGAQVHTVDAGQAIIMPANEPHALDAPEPFKMLLTMIRA